MKIHDDFIYTKKLNLDVETLRQSSFRMRDIIMDNFYDEAQTEGSVGNSTDTTSRFASYNVFMYPLPGFYDLFQAVKKTFKLISDSPEPYYMQALINVYEKGQFFDWHGHWPTYMKSWHGFYCVDTEREPSYTEYKRDGFDKLIRIDSQDDMMVIAPTGEEKHRTSVWNNLHPRITIAFDLVPGKHIDHGINHWIPV